MFKSIDDMAEDLRRVNDMLKERATDPEFKKLPVSTQFEILRASGQLKETSVEMQKLIDNMLRLPKE